jgi:hypothetical protein
MTNTIVLENVEFSCPLLCDDIRREQSGKLILIGVYSSQILLTQFPGNMSLSIFGEISPKRLGEINIEFQFCLDDEPTSGIEMNLTIGALDTDLFATPPIPLTLNAPGVLSLRCREERGEWVETIRKTIAKYE